MRCYWLSIACLRIKIEKRTEINYQKGINICTSPNDTPGAGKICLQHLHLMFIMHIKFHCNLSKTVEVVCFTKLLTWPTSHVATPIHLLHPSFAEEDTIQLCKVHIVTSTGGQVPQVTVYLYICHTTSILMQNTEYCTPI